MSTGEHQFHLINPEKHTRDSFNYYLKGYIAHFNRGFHKLPTKQEWHYCQLRFRCATRNEQDWWRFQHWNVKIFYPLMSNFMITNANKEEKWKYMGIQSWHWCYFCQLCVFVKISNWITSFTSLKKLVKKVETQQNMIGYYCRYSDLFQVQKKVSPILSYWLLGLKYLSVQR